MGHFTNVFPSYMTGHEEEEEENDKGESRWFNTEATWLVRFVEVNNATSPCRRSTGPAKVAV